jgi:chaperonin GroEL (HSP60 family)
LDKGFQHTTDRKCTDSNYQKASLKITMRNKQRIEKLEITVGMLKEEIFHYRVPELNKKLTALENYLILSLETS